MNLSSFTNRYQQSKTLRFELIPQGRTLEYIQLKGLIARDEQRAESYQKMKKTIDGFHKYFIELAMQQVRLTHLEAFQDLYFAPAERKREEAFKKELESVQAALRKEIAQGFQSGEAKEIFSKIGKKELITELLEKWISQQAGKDIYFDDSFKNFTTYFGGFYENRRNMYSDKAQSTAIAYRLIHENLPKFLDNSNIFKRIKSVPEIYGKCPTLYKEIEEYLNIPSIDEAFNLGYFNEVLTQKQIDVYNLIIGGRTLEDGGRKIQGLNEYINLYNQKQSDKGQRVPKLKPLYKQILSDREGNSFVADKFENSREVVDAINGFYHYGLISFLPEGKDDTENVLAELQSILANIKDYDLRKIYIRNDRSITDISQAVFGDWGLIKNALEFAYRQQMDTGKKRLSAKQEAEVEKYLKQSHFAIAEIEDALFNYRNEVESLNGLNKEDLPIASYFKTHFKTTKKHDGDKEFDFLSNINAKYSCVKGVLENYPEDRALHQDKIAVDNIKQFLDALMELLHFVKPLVLPNDSTLEKDDVFYSQLNVWYEQLNQLVALYNKVRNYATQKPYSTEKFKLNFENATLLKGWDKNKETENTAVLLRKKNERGKLLYYLAIMPQENKNVFKTFPKPNQSDLCFEKVDYKQIALPMGFGAFVRKCSGTASQLGWICPDSCKNVEGKIIIKEDEVKGNRSELIDCYKSFLNVYEKDGFQYKDYEFRFKESQEYDSLSQFFTEVEQQGYKISFQDISEHYIHQLVDEGKLYLFQIYNKDFSPFSNGTPNMHTLYWRALFDAENLKDVVYKLNGQAEIFYRKKSIDSDKLVVHRANEPINNKNPKAVKKQSEFAYDLIKDKRFTVDKFQFHVPIALNFKATGGDFINRDVLEFLKNNRDVNIIGIDRGERHLIYISLIDQNGNILQQETLNTIVNKKHNIETPYHTLLAAKEKERDEARRNWGTIENIKELKEGYLSQVVHKIAKMMVDNNAIVVMENLNSGFKRGRFKVERQVYQKLEKMLINKLNYLVLKDKESHEPGGLYKALQLTSKFTAFKDLDKQRQSGFLFYVPAWNTSKIDPTTGFVNLFNTKYENIERSQKFFANFKSIRFNADQGYFEFAFDYNDFTTRAEGTKTDWVVCTFGDRIQTFRDPEANNQWNDKAINLTEQFEDLFGKHNIVYGDGQCLKNQIAALDDKEFFKSLLSLFKLTLQMRNSKTGTDIDYLISPVMNDQGEFYDSRKADASLPKDADANGAYHIAKKGLWILEQIDKADNLKNIKLAISNKDWLNFVQKRQGE